MRARIIKRERYSTKSLQKNHSDINYADWISAKDDSPTPKRKKSIIKVKKEPSSSRIAAQQEIIKKKAPKLPVNKTVSNSDDAPKPKPKKFLRKNPHRMIPVHRRTYSTRSKWIKNELTEAEDDPVPDTTTTTPIDTTPKLSPATSPKPKPKGKLVTTDHTLQRFKKECYFRCPVCLIHKMMTFKLNEHYKRRHPPLKCEHCTMTFVTPSGLSRHKYVHTVPRYLCTDCTESFHFESQLKQHRVKHLKVQSHFCNFGSCT